MEKLFRRIHLLTHFSSDLQMRNLLIFITIINKAQEIYLAKKEQNLDNNSLSTIIYLVDYCFALDAVSNTQFILIIIAYFIIHILFIGAFVYMHLSNKLPLLIFTILNGITFYYTLILAIPSSYSSLVFVYRTDICSTSTICSDGLKIGLTIICLINCISSLIMIFVMAYFGRCEQLMQDNNILILDYPIVLRIIIRCLIIVVCVLKAIDQLQPLRFVFLLIKNTIYIITTFKRLNYQAFIIMEYFSMVICISINFDFSIYEFFLGLTFGLTLIIQVKNNINSYFFLSKQQKNLQTVQIFDRVNSVGDKQSQVIVATMQRNHQCLKCKIPNQITECILRKMSNEKNTQQKTNILLYSNYIANHAPLKALMKIILQKPNDVYFKCSFPNLSMELFNRAQQTQSAALHKNTVRSTSEHIASLDVESVYNTSNSSGVLFPIIIETLQSKINFWNKLLNGYQDIDHYLNETLKTTTKMLKCRSEVERRFDLQNYKLKSSQFTDILSMRIIQIYYTGIYANSFLAYSLEKSIEDIMKNERFKQDESLDNIQLVQNRLIILRSSLIRNRGELINVNAKQLSQFLGGDEEELKSVKHCNHLMPPFLTQIHDKLMDNYLQRGYSKLMIHGESTFYQSISGYIEQCSINLYNFFDGKDDFVLNMIITKQQSNNETVIFGVDGRILGITKGLFEDLIRNSLKATIQTLKSSTTNDTIQDFLVKTPLIQCFLPDIYNQVLELRQQIQSTSNYLTNNLKSIWQVPTNQNEMLLNVNSIFSKFKKKTNEALRENYKTFSSQTYSRYSYHSHITQLDCTYDNSEFSNEVQNKISVDGIPIILLHPDVQSQIIQITSCYFDSQPKTSQMQVFYNLQFKTLAYKQGIYGYFIMTVKEFKNVQGLSNYQTSQGSNVKNIHPSQELNNSSLIISNIMDQKSDIQDSQDIYIQEVKLMNNLNNKVRELVDSANQSQVIDNSFKAKQSERSNLFDSSRQPLFAKPKLCEHDISNDVEQIEQDMQIIKELRLEYVEDEQEGEERKIQSKSVSFKKNSNLLEKFRTKQMQSKEKGAADFASNPSRTSTNSTSKESLYIVQQLYYNTQLIVPLRKISFLLFLICTAILICNILNVQIISDNLISQTEQLATLRQPQNINFFYTSAILQEWYQYLQTLNIVTLSPFLNQRNIETLQGMYDYARTTMIDLSIIVPELAKRQGFGPNYSMQFVNEGITSVIEYKREEFYQILYEITEDSYRKNLGKTKYNYTEILSTGVVRVNLLQMIDFHNQLIMAITSSTISAQASVKSYFLSVMIGEMFSVFVIIGLQLRYWLFIDHIVKSILFLVSRLNENQAQDQINKLMIIKEQLENQNYGNWKLFNFGEVMYGFSEKKAKKIILKQNSAINQNNVKTSSALYSRIQRTYYLNRYNTATTFIITLTWTAFLMTGFLIHMAKNDNFQPSLTVTLKFVQFRHNMDSLSLLAGLIKTEPLIPNYNLSFLNQTRACELLIQYRDNLSPLINEVAQVILQTANANNAQSRFDTVLNYNLCLSSSITDTPFCDLSKITLPYDPNDVYLDIISNGALGYTAALIKFINQDFNYEIQNLKYSFDQQTSLEIVKSKQFQNFILQYFADIQTAMRNFLVLFQSDNTSIADGIISVIQVYYYGFGICLFISFIIVSFVWIQIQQKKIQSLRQILVLIPSEHILTTNVRSQARAIHSMLY